MNRYNVIVSITEPNPNFESEQKAYESRSAYNPNYGLNPPTETREVRVLTVALSEDEFVAMKRSVLEVFK